MKKTVVSIFFCLTALCSLAQSAEELYQKAVTLSHQGAMTESLKYLIKSADAGYAPAQSDLGIYYNNQSKSVEDATNAIKYLSLANEQGDVTACAYLGSIYYQHPDFRDLEKAIYFTTNAAENGNPIAQYNLSMMYNLGDGIEENPELSFKWAKLSADQGYADACAIVMNCYFYGYAVESDVDTAIHYGTIGAEGGNVEACSIMGAIYLAGELVEPDYQRAFKYNSIAADAGIKESQYYLSLQYMFEMGVEKDEALVFYWTELSAQQGFPDALYNLGSCYLKGIGTETNLAEAKKYYIAAADASYDGAQEAADAIE